MSRPHNQALAQLGRYTLLQEVAEGGMARVFLARRAGSNKLCVLKQLHGELEEHSTATIRFQREAHIISQLDHPNIARVLDAGLEDGKFCIAMELIEGATLRQILDVMDERNQIIPPAITLRAGVEVLDGLAHAHSLCAPTGRSLEIVHRDLSPKNIMLAYDGSVKIIDFGVAQGRIDNFQTAPGMIVGTLAYMSPEQALSEATDPRSDIYTLSVVLWEMLSGKPVVRDGKAVEMLEQVIGETPPPLHVVDPGLDRGVSEVIARGLEKEPERRWQSAASYRDALREATRSLGGINKTQMGGFVRYLFPPERHPAARWVDHLPTSDRIVETPTLADDSLRAEDVRSFLPDLPAPSESGSQTLSDHPLPTLDLERQGRTTTPDMAVTATKGLDEVRQLAKRLHHLETTIERQRRAIFFLLVLLVTSGAAWAALFGGFFG